MRRVHREPTCHLARWAGLALSIGLVAAACGTSGLGHPDRPRAGVGPAVGGPGVDGAFGRSVGHAVQGARRRPSSASRAAPG